MVLYERHSIERRILFIIDSLYEYGGTEKHLYYLTRELSQKGFRCYLVALEHSHEMLKKYASVGAELIFIKLSRVYSLNAYKIVKKLIRVIRCEKISIIQSYNGASDFLAAIVTMMSRNPVHVINLRDMGKYRLGRYNIVIRFLSLFNKHEYVAVSHAVARDRSLMRYKDRQTVEVIYNGVDEDVLNYNVILEGMKWRKKWSIPENAFVVGNISHFRSEKGHDVFFRAIDIVKREISEVICVVVGGGRLLSKYQEIYKTKQMKGIYLTGYLEDVYPALASMDVFCFTPTSNEGFSNSVLEAMALGKPVIASDVGGNREAVLHEVTGIMVQSRNPRSAADAIIRLYRSRKRRKSMGCAGKSRIKKHFTLNGTVQQYKQYYDRVIMR